MILTLFVFCIIIIKLMVTKLLSIFMINNGNDDNDNYVTLIKLQSEKHQAEMKACDDIICCMINVYVNDGKSAKANGTGKIKKKQYRYLAAFCEKHVKCPNSIHFIM